MSDQRRKKKVEAMPGIGNRNRECMCIHYESSEEDDDIGMGACHCGHSPEDHDRMGCNGEVRDAR